MLALDFDFGTVWEFLFNEQIVRGAWRTIQVAVIAQVIGIALGVVFALMRVARNPVAQVIAGTLRLDIPSNPRPPPALHPLLRHPAAHR